mmetsp:Transcript_10216/g.33452  ORF Transcript_10216/g.33452 Transcript_10216/m.33452 type:complete len:1592 (+) Transcript_10216:74-4849(+)
MQGDGDREKKLEEEGLEADAEVGHHEEEVTKVVQSLHDEYLKQYQRGNDYKNLFFFLVYGMFWMAVMYMQRSATDAYAVTHTLGAQLLPGGAGEDTQFELASKDEVYDWLEGIISSVWLDPVCGDGVCEEPFEFPSYGRFGCRADCKQLNDRLIEGGVYNVSTLQIDLYYDFSHVKGSTPSTTLMQDTSWNLCPQLDTGEPAKHGTDCYYEEDQTFGSLKGHEYVLLNDVPDGTWEIRVWGDIFQKVAGAVRSHDNVTYESTVLKLAKAKEAALVKVEKELTIRQEVAGLLAMTDLELMINEAEMTMDANIQLLNQSYVAGSLPWLNYTNGTQALQKAFNERKLELAQLSDLCVDDPLPGAPPAPPPSPFPPPPPPYYCNCTELGLNSTHATAAGLNMTQIIIDGMQDTWCCNSTWMPTDCDHFYTARHTAKEAHTYQTRLMLINTETTAMAAGERLLTNWLASLKEEQPMIHFEIVGSTGTDASNLRGVSTQKLYEHIANTENRCALSICNSPPSKKLASYRINKSPWTNLTVANDERIAEMQDSVRVNALIDPIGDAYAGLPQTYTSWPGGRNHFMVCELEARASSYAGVCSDADWLYPDEAQVSEKLIDQASKYRQACTTLCHCETPCFAGTTCICDECRDGNRRRLRHLLESDADMDEFARSFAAAHGGYEPAIRVARQLLQTTDLNDIMLKLDEIVANQNTLETAVTDVQTEQSQQNAAAQAFYADTTLRDAMDTGFSDLSKEHDDLTALLQEIIGLQQLANEQFAALEAGQKKLEDLTNQQAEAQRLLLEKVNTQLEQIRLAQEDGFLTAKNAADMQWKALLDEKNVTKLNTLANSPCTTDLRTYPFSINNYFEARVDDARIRRVGLTNRVIAGMMLHTTRYDTQNCTSSRFDNIQAECTAGVDTTSFGVDPVFKLGTDLYNPDLNNDKDMARLYNCSHLEDPTYIAGGGNQYPFCTELFNENGVPWGFQHRPVDGYDPGFPVFLDINLSERTSAEYLSFIKDGLFLNDLTATFTMQMITYNAELDHFANIMVIFEFTNGGIIEMSYQVMAVRVELYRDDVDYGRLVMEILLNLFSLVQLYSESMDLFQAKREYGTYRAYFRSGWNYIDLASIACSISANILWWIFVFDLAETFDTEIRYDVYYPLGGQGDASARFFNLFDNGSQLDAVADVFWHMTQCANYLSLYMTINGVNIILYLLRVLKLMDFQPRMGVVTRSLFLAAPDLLHFFLLMLIIFLGYVMMGHLIFGYGIEKFSTPGEAASTCFEILLGEIGVSGDLNNLQGWDRVPGILWFWSYNILVLMIMLNFLLAIICDAFSEVKGEASETTGMHTEVAELGREAWRTAMKPMLFPKHIPARRIRHQLAEWLGKDPLEEEQGDDVWHEPQRIVKVDEEELDKERLKRILRGLSRASLRKAAETRLTEEAKRLKADEEEDEDEEESRLGKLMASFKKISKPAVKAAGDTPIGIRLTEEDIEMAAELILETCGEDKEDEEEEDADDLSELLRRVIDGQQDVLSGQRELQTQHNAIIASMSGEAPPISRPATALGEEKPNGKSPVPSEGDAAEPEPAPTEEAKADEQGAAADA